MNRKPINEGLAAMLKLEPAAAKRTRVELEKLINTFETQELLAEQLEVALPSIRRFLDGGSNGSPYLAYRVSLLADIPLSELVGEPMAKILQTDENARRRPGRAVVTNAKKADHSQKSSVRRAESFQGSRLGTVDSPAKSSTLTSAPSISRGLLEDAVDDATLTRIARGSGRQNELERLAHHYRELVRLTVRMQNHIVRSVLDLD